MHALVSLFKGNNNRKGQILGTVLHKNGKPVQKMDTLVSNFKHNKNKTGQTLG